MIGELTLADALRRADELDEALWLALPDPYCPADTAPRERPSLMAALISVEHCRAGRVLLHASLHTTAIATGRLQFESLCRSIWLLYAAQESEVAKVVAPLTAEAAKTANDLPSIAKMIDALAGSNAPPLAILMLQNFKNANLKPLHQFVHAGFHPLRRWAEGGYPEKTLVAVLRNSNGLLVMAAAMLAVLAARQDCLRTINRLQLGFADCLPDLHRASG